MSELVATELTQDTMEIDGRTYRVTLVAVENVRFDVRKATWRWTVTSGGEEIARSYRGYVFDSAMEMARAAIAEHLRQAAEARGEAA